MAFSANTRFTEERYRPHLGYVNTTQWVATVCRTTVGEAREIIRDAAKALQMSEESVRYRIRRGVLRPKSVYRLAMRYRAKEGG